MPEHSCVLLALQPARQAASMRAFLQKHRMPPKPRCSKTGTAFIDADTQNPVHCASTETCRPANSHLLPRARTPSEPGRARAGTGGGAGGAGHPPAGTGGAPRTLRRRRDGPAGWSRIHGAAGIQPPKAERCGAEMRPGEDRPPPARPPGPGAAPWLPRTL